MNKGFKKILVSFFFALTLPVFTTDVAAQLDAKQNQGFDFSNLIDAFYSSLRTVKNLNYYTNEKVVFVIAGQEVSFDIQAGHGNIFTPLKPVAAQINPVKFGANNTGYSDKASLAGFAKIVIENELYKNAKDIEVLKWLMDFKLNPVQLFTFKFLILLNTARTDGEWSRVIEETFCLLFRLSQVEDLKFIDKTKRLSTYLPESLKNVLKDNKFGLVEFIDELWAVLVNDISDASQAVGNSIQIKNFVFRDEAIAKLVFEQFKNYTDTKESNTSSQNAGTVSLQDQINSFIKPNGYGIVDMQDFVNYRSDISAPNNKFAQTMVGYEEFLFSNNSDKQADLINQVNQINSLQEKLPKFIFAHDQTHNEYLVAYVTQDMSLINTLKQALITLCVSFKEYLQTKKTIFTKTDEASLKYKTEFAAKEKCRIELEKFVRSQEGSQFFSQIKNEIETIVSSNESISQNSPEQSRQEQITSLKSELEKLEKQKNEKVEQLAKWQKILTLHANKNAPDVQAKIESIKSEISKIDAQILTTQKDLNDLVSEKLEVNKCDSASVEKDKKNLAKLYKMLEDKQRVGGVPSDKLLSTIKTLEDRIVQSAQSSTQPVAIQKSINEKLTVREAVANLLDNKADELNMQIDSKLKDLDLIKDIEDRVIQELLLDENISLQKSFVRQLQATAKQIRLDNEKAKMLEAYRKAFSSVSSDKISKDKLDQITKLELEVGHIIDGEKHEDFVANIMLRDSFLSEFVKDITENADKFMYVKERLQNSLTQILAHSSHFKNNAKLYAYLWKTIPSHYKTFLGCVGITEQSLS